MRCSHAGLGHAFRAVAADLRAAGLPEVLALVHSARTVRCFGDERHERARV